MADLVVRIDERQQTVLALADVLGNVLIALEESVRLQSHYARLLNMHDGGERIGFMDANEWIARLVKIGKIK